MVLTFEGMTDLDVPKCQDLSKRRVSELRDLEAYEKGSQGCRSEGGLNYRLECVGEHDG